MSLTLVLNILPYSTSPWLNRYRTRISTGTFESITQGLYVKVINTLFLNKTAK